MVWRRCSNANVQLRRRQRGAYRITEMVGLKLIVLTACVALAGAFAPLAAPLSSRTVAASPACSGIVMIRHANKLKKLNRPADQRKALLRGLTTELIRHGRIKTTTIRCKELRKTTDHMVTLAKDGSLHARRQVLGYPYPYPYPYPFPDP